MKWQQVKCFFGKHQFPRWRKEMLKRRCKGKGCGAVQWRDGAALPQAKLDAARKELDL